MADPTAAVFGRQDVEILGREFLHQGHLRVERLRLRCRRYEGGWSHPFLREVLVREQGVGVLPYDPVTDKVLLVEQFRVGCLDDAANGPWALELIAGLQDTDEDLETLARREAVEEAGLELDHLIPVASYYNSPGGSSERLSVYCARFDSSCGTGIHGLEGEAENIRTLILDREQALAALAGGRINNAMSIIALLWLQLNLANVREKLLAQGA